MIKALVLLAIAASGQAQQFDLVCNGDRKLDLLAPASPYQFRLRVDLGERRWCQDECDRIQSIADVQPSVITFETESPEDKLLRNTHTRLVNRETGKYMLYINERIGDPVVRLRSVQVVEATCEPAPFSGFPKIDTKF